MSVTTVILITFIVLLSVLVLVLLLILAIYWRRLRHPIYHYQSSLIKSSASSPLAPPRYVPSSQMSSVVDCSSQLDVHHHGGHWAHIGADDTLARPLKPIRDQLDDDDDDDDEAGCQCDERDSVDKPPPALLTDSLSARSSPSVSCEQLSALDCDTVDDDDDDVTSSTRHDDVTAVSRDSAAAAVVAPLSTMYRRSW